MLPFLHINFLFLHREQPTFGIMMWLAAVTAAFIMYRSFRRAGVDADAIGMVAVAMIAGMIGAKLWHVLDSPAEFHDLGWSVLWDTDGFAWFGGLTFGIVALLVQGWRAKIGALRTLDLAAPAAAVGYGIGRIGCFLSGDGCYGIAIQPVHFLSFTFLPWGMSFPKGIEPVFVPVYPTPLYELAAGLLIGGWLWWRAGKPSPTGAILGRYLLLCGLARFLVEFLRRNPKVLWGLSNAQLASAGSILAGIILIAWASKRQLHAPHQAGAAMKKAA
ncbi:MAG: prolipoprotein diacylglyceryl transferase family protein [Terracidiphilus sp.]|jgi:phosphatidylglycerol:prolipoprotein diacylglycerol transferase